MLNEFYAPTARHTANEDVVFVRQSRVPFQKLHSVTSSKLYFRVCISGASKRNYFWFLPSLHQLT